MPDELFEKFRDKVVEASDLLKAIGLFPRNQKVIMCHGVFDVVHPGHIRHFAYAKSKAEILVVSVTADKHIKKGAYRPHIPQNLRALNVAAYEFVDYVIVDEEPTPLKNLGSLQPDFFAKGFEYSESGLLPATREEANVVSEYGGQIIFTPGDVVYSSSQFLESMLPSLKLEKLLALMDQFRISFDDLRATVDGFAGLRVHTVGDTINDTYTRASLIGGQVKTPTFSVLYQGKEDYVGGAGIVAQHMRAAGADVCLSTVLGDDQLKEFAIHHLQEAGVTVRSVIDSTRPTTNKNVIISDSYRLLKIDTVDNRPISEKILQQLCEQIDSTSVDCVVFSDFRHGIFNKSSIPLLTASIPNGAMRVADSQVSTRWGNITEFKKFDLVTPNEREARFALADQESTIGSLAGDLHSHTQAENIILKLGSRGVFFSGRPEGKEVIYHSVDSFVDRLEDPVGAGDALLAYATLAMLVSGSLAQASILGSFAAGCECEHDGNIPIRPQDVHKKIDMVESSTTYEEQ